MLSLLAEALLCPGLSLSHVCAFFSIFLSSLYHFSNRCLWLMFVHLERDFLRMIAATSPLISPFILFSLPLRVWPQHSLISGSLCPVVPALLKHCRSSCGSLAKVAHWYEWKITWFVMYHPCVDKTVLWCDYFVS